MLFTIRNLTVYYSHSNGCYGRLSQPLFQSEICNFSTNFPFILWSLGNRIVFFFLPEAFCGRKRAENAIAAGAPPPTPLGSSRRSPDSYSRLGRGHPSPYPTHSAPLPRRCSRLRGLDRRAPPLTPNPGDTTGHHNFLR